MINPKDEEFFEKETENLISVEKKMRGNSSKKTYDDLLLESLIEKMDKDREESKNWLKELVEEIKGGFKKLIGEFCNIKQPVIQKVDFPEKQKVEVDFPEVQKVGGEVVVKNFPKIEKFDEAKILNRLDSLKKTIEGLRFPEPIKEVLIKNLNEIPRVEFPQKIVSEIPKKTFNEILDTLKKQKIDFRELVEFFAQNPDYYLNVRLTDGKEWYKAISEIISAAGGGGVIPFVDSTGKQKPAKVRDDDQRLEVHVISQKEFTIFTEYEAGPHLKYLGEAEAGSLSSEAKWRIKMITWSGSSFVSQKWANGDTLFTKVWDNRADYSYS